MDYMNLLTMVVVGMIAGTAAARIVKGDNFGFLMNSLLGIAGAIVGGFIFKALDVSPGAGIVRIIDETFDVQLPENFVGMVVSATVGAIILLFVSKTFRRRRVKKHIV